MFTRPTSRFTSGRCVGLFFVCLLPRAFFVDPVVINPQVLNDHAPYELCGRPFGPVVTKDPPHARQDPDPKLPLNRSAVYEVCVAQGGAG